VPSPPRIRAQCDRDTARQQIDYRRNAIGQLQLRSRRHDDRRALLRDEADFMRIDVHGVRQQCACRKQTVRVQRTHRRHAETLYAEPHAMLRFRSMHDEPLATLVCARRRRQLLVRECFLRVQPEHVRHRALLVVVHDTFFECDVAYRHMTAQTQLGERRSTGVFRAVGHAVRRDAGRAAERGFRE
jgi:hypothetical protein